MPTLDPRLAGLTKTRQPEAVHQFTRDHLGFGQHATAQHHLVRTLREARRAEHALHQRLVHADRRGEHAAADIRHVGEFEQALHRAVLAVRPVQHREDHVEPDARDDRARFLVGAPVRPVDRQDGLLARPREQVHLASGAQGLHLRACLLDDLRGRGGRRRLVGQRPAPVPVDADRHRLVAGAIEVGHDGGGRGDRDFVLARAATVDDAYAQFLQGLWGVRDSAGMAGWMP